MSEQTITEKDTRSLQEHVEEFNQKGYTLIKGALTEEHADALRAAVLKVFEGPDHGYGGDLRLKMFEHGEIFEELLEHKPAVDFAGEVLGSNFHMFSNNALRTSPGGGIDWWHVDEDLFLPLPEGVELDPRIQLPIYMFSAMYYLVDVTEDMGPTQLVPGSHRSGAHPASPTETPNYKGQGPISVLAEKGDLLLFNGQTWHRGATNNSDRFRIVQQVTYGRRWVSQRFYPFINYMMPQDIIDRAEGNALRTRLLGMHPRGPYG